MDDTNSHWQNVLKRQATGQYFQTYLSLINTTNDHFENTNPTVLKIETPLAITHTNGNNDSPTMVSNTTRTQLQNVVTSTSPSKKRIKREPDRGPGRGRRNRDDGKGELFTILDF